VMTAEPSSRPREPVVPDPPVRSRSPIGTIVRVLVILALFGGLAVAFEGGWERLREFEWQFEPWSVGGSFLVMLGASIWAASSWYVVARAFTAPIGLLPALRIYSTSNLGKYLPGKVWHAFARVYLTQQQGVPLPLATATVVVDIVLYIAAGLLMTVLALPTIMQAIGLTSGPLATVVALIGVAVGLALLHPAAMNQGFRVAQRLMPRKTFPQIEVSYPTILKIFVLYVVLWGLNAVGLYAGLRAVTEIAPSTLPTLSAIYAVSYLSGLIMPLAPAGLGVREGLMVLLLSQIVPVPAAAAASVLIRVLQVAAEGVCATVFSRT
jgi:glycosyltransferase 2 family protein